MDFDENTPSYDASKIAAALIANGYMPIPVAKGEKRPVSPNWTTRSFTPEDFLPDMNIGIRCGDARVAFLDVDIYCDRVVSQIVAEWHARFGERGAKMQRIGAPPKVGIPFRTDEMVTKMAQTVRSTGKAPVTAQGQPKLEQVEVLAAGQQFVAYGIHPDIQQPYHWTDLSPIDECVGHIEDLPQISVDEILDFLSWISELFGPPTQTTPLSEGAAPKLNPRRRADKKGDVIGHFNRMHKLTDLMRQYGYTHRRGEHWTSPKSGTGSANVQVLGERWRSLSGSDAAAGVGAETKGGIRAGDAFDLFVAFEHDGDFNAAVRSYRSKIGMQEKSSHPDTRSYDELMVAAENLEADHIDDIEAIVSECAVLQPMRQEAILRKIKSATGLPLSALRQQLTQAHGAKLEPDHLDFARTTLEQIGHENIICADAFFWFWQDRGVWVQQEDRAIKQVIQKCVDEEPAVDVTANLVNSVCDVLKSEIYRPEHKFNLGNPETVNCLNGELRLDDNLSWRLEPHCREGYRTTQIPVEYDDKADAPLFCRFLDEIFEDDNDKPEKTRSILELMGYSLMSHARHERFVMLIGPGANGKSVLLDVLQNLLGPRNVAGVQPSNFSSRFQRAHLHQKLANIVTELKQGEVIADAELKAITSGEPATVEHKHRDPFVIRPFATCWFGTNHMPHTRDFSEALFRRATIIQFNRVFEEWEQDPLLKEKLVSELPGILNISLKAYASALEKGFTEPVSSRTAKNEWRLEADQAAQFVEAICKRDASSRFAMGDVYRVYSNWAAANGIRHKLSQKGLRDRLTLLGFGSQKSGSTRYVTGISVTVPF